MNFKLRKQHNPEVFDASTLEDDVVEAFQNSRAVERFAPPPPPPTVNDIGNVTAEAVMAQYDAASKTILEMKTPMQEWSSQCQTALADLEAAMKYIEETAARFREIGQSTHDRIQKSSVAITEVRQTCDDIRAKIDPQVS